MLYNKGIATIYEPSGDVCRLRATYFTSEDGCAEPATVTSHVQDSSNFKGILLNLIQISDAL